MWSSTTNQSAATTAKNNKKKEEVEDCRCSSAAVDAASSGSSSGLQNKQQLNNFDNSKKQTSLGGDNLTGGGGGAEKEYDLAEAEIIDSGFISGPQTSSNIFSDEDEEYASSGAVVPNKFNIAPSAPPSQQKTEEEENYTFDSGCIHEYEDDNCTAEAEAEAIVEEQQSKTSEEQAQKQVSYELSNVAVAAGSAAFPSNEKNNDDQMIIKKNVDAGMSEWFCNLSLQTDAPHTQQQQQQVEGGSISINNLNSAGGSGVRKVVAAPSATTSTVATESATSSCNNQNRNSNRQAAESSAASITTSNTTNTTITLTPSNAWEQFYQQNDDGDTPLHLACISGFVDVVAALIRMAPHPCLFNLQNDEAQTPLHLAALTAQPKILRMLLIAGAEPTIRDRHGNTALHLACISGEEQCVRALIIKISASEIQEAHRLYGHRSNDKTVSYLSCAPLPSDLEIRNYDGERCVHLAAQAGHIEILRILVFYGADINAREGKSGRSPLHIAIEGCNEDLSNFLLDECQKLDLETETYGGLTAYQVACILNKSEMQNILEKKGAEPLTPPDSDYDSSDIEADLDDSKLYDRFGDPGYFVGYNGGSYMTVA